MKYLLINVFYVICVTNLHLTSYHLNKVSKLIFIDVFPNINKLFFIKIMQIKKYVSKLRNFIFGSMFSLARICDTLDKEEVVLIVRKMKQTLSSLF